MAPAVRRTVGAELRVIPGMGHLTTENNLPDVVELVARAAG